MTSVGKADLALTLYCKMSIITTSHQRVPWRDKPTSLPNIHKHLTTFVSFAYVHCSLLLKASDPPILIIYIKRTILSLSMTSLLHIWIQLTH